MELLANVSSNIVNFEVIDRLGFRTFNVEFLRIGNEIGAQTKLSWSRK